MRSFLMGRRVGILAVAGLATLVLAGCGSSSEGMAAGDAAVAETFRITQAQVAEQVAAVQAAGGQPTAEPPAGLTVASVQRLVITAVVGRVAEEVGVSVSDAEVDADVAQLVADNGGKDALEAAALQAGIPPDAIDDVVRVNLLVSAIGRTLQPDGEGGAQVAAAQERLAAYSREADVQVAPRYGTWDHASLAVQAGSR
jgi:hypothetical protein